VVHHCENEGGGESLHFPLFVGTEQFNVTISRSKPATWRSRFSF